MKVHNCWNFDRADHFTVRITVKLLAIRNLESMLQFYIADKANDYVADKTFLELVNWMLPLDVK